MTARARASGAWVLSLVLGLLLALGSYHPH
jgi:hypothetical protein